MAEGNDVPTSAEAGDAWWRKLRRSMMPVFIGLTAALLALAIAIALTIVAQREARIRAVNEAGTLFALQSVMRVMLEAESSQRGYVLTGDSDYMRPYLDAKQRLGPAVANLRWIAARADDDQTSSRINWIAGLANAKFAEMDRTVSLTRSGLQSQAQLIIDSEIGNQQMNAIREAIRIESFRKVSRRRDAFTRAATLERRLVPLIIILGVAILSLIAAGFRAERSRAAAAAKAEQADVMREANERAQLLARELNHRVKNLFSVILSIVTLSGRKQSPASEIVESIRARIHALSLAHATSQGAVATASVQLGSIIARTMEPYSDDEGLRVRLSGPPIDLPVRMITPLSMIIHELATNAVKYGALSVERGSVEVRWQLEADLETDRLALTWIETAGPELSFGEGEPPGTGFGSKMIALATRQLGGSIRREWPPSGAFAEIRFPLPRNEIYN